MYEKNNSDFGLDSSTSGNQQLEFKTRIRYDLSLLKVLLALLLQAQTEVHAEAQNFRIFKTCCFKKVKKNNPCTQYKIYIIFPVLFAAVPT